MHDALNAMVCCTFVQPRVRDPTGATPLHECAKSGSRECAKLLLSREADVNEADNDAATPLHLVRDWASNCASTFPEEGIFVDDFGICTLDAFIHMFRYYKSHILSLVLYLHLPFLARLTSIPARAGLVPRLLRDGAAVLGPRRRPLPARQPRPHALEVRRGKWENGNGGATS